MRTRPGRGPRAIRLRGVRTHNLRGIDVSIPTGKITVVTGVSGSGKSSLALDTIYAEGRRRYVECLSTYMQQFLERLARPEVDAIETVPPAVAIGRSVPAVQARSTVGTTTEIADYLRLLFARVGRTFCLDCGERVVEEAPGDVAGALIERGGTGTVSFEIRAPARGWRGFRDELLRDGFVRIVRDGAPLRLEDATRRSGPIEVIVDRLRFEAGRRSRIVEAVETAYRFGSGRCIARGADGAILRRFSSHLHCAGCDREYARPEPNLFSANSPLGACPTCQGFGRSIGPDLERILPDRGKTLRERPVEAWNTPAHRKNYTKLREAGREAGLRWDVPYDELTDDERGVVEQTIARFFKRLERKTYKVHVRVFLARYRAYQPCSACGGAKLRPEALAVLVGGLDLAHVGVLPIERLLPWVEGLELDGQEAAIAAPVLVELKRRLRYLVEVGLGYLHLERPSRTLSGGEAQRIRLAQAVGSGLVDTLYVLDEPSVGLHPLDVERLIGVVRRLRDLGNTIVLVEHDVRLMREADWLIDLGPGAGAEGGRLLYEGRPAGVTRVRGSLTGDFLAGRRRIGEGTEPAPDSPGEAGWIELRGAAANNLRDIDVRFRRGALTVVTGVSGAGKSSLVHDTLHGALARALADRVLDVGPYEGLDGVEGLAGVELVDQSPIGRSSRSNPVTYVKAFDGIRKRLAATPAAHERGLRPGFFSFNVPGGRCEACEGAGAVTVEMHFMPDLLVPCESCDGSRFGPAALAIRDRGRTVAEILELTVAEALEVYGDVPDVARRLGVLDEIGLGYLRLGQPAPTLSGGESQRLKLASHLAGRGGGPMVFLLDEPTTGLHPWDVAVLVRLLRRLTAKRHTVIVVEHHVELIEAADRVIDLGPGPGEAGGLVVAEGTPGEVAASGSATGRYLASRAPSPVRARRRPPARRRAARTAR